LSENRALSSKEIAYKAAMSERTVRHALKILKEHGLVEEIFFLGDMRRRGYKRVAKTWEYNPLIPQHSF
jgi:DNA-binding transcriptional ArsR family regulator